MQIILALAQINPHVGDLEGNCGMMLDAAQTAKRAGADLVLFPELTLTGYPPEDLLHKPLFLERVEQQEKRLRQGLAEMGVDVLYGAPRRLENGDVLNAAMLVEDGRETFLTAKWNLPNYGVFDEQRYFVHGEEANVHTYRDLPIGITVCEDVWHAHGPARTLMELGAAILLNLNASPYHLGKWRERESVVSDRIHETGLPVVYVNQVGGQDELVFDGGSFVMDSGARVSLRCGFFREEIRLTRISWDGDGPAQLDHPKQTTVQNQFLRTGYCGPWRAAPHSEPFLSPTLDREREIWGALTLGIRDYVRKNGFTGVVIGLSGGIDSALTLTICVDALGAERVEAVMMPSQYTADHSNHDAIVQANRLGVRLASIPIGRLFDQFKADLAEEFAGRDEDVTEENIQPRIRGTLLMAISNKKGLLLVTTGNKSEVSMGYATLYGDMAGGYSVLKDVLKMTVYDLARARNRWAEEVGLAHPTPQNVIDKAPSAELRPDQKDSDSLPPYPILDRILKLYVEQERSLAEIESLGIDRDLAARVIATVDRNEYKRRQAPPGVRITARAFGKDRRYPITNGFKVC
ncbi:NAD+ synthase [Magnetofaba australis]|uniref:Glutamine-dependent NAD(+) synthetase n=1 Tax=Magnetofaba australis IT-1 TaxID=1434232 RepID=A0A1Y2K2V4_9PROT|nr:NAD+ synthase [Magnetofaba australis]OSM01385.1 putative NAD+ synthetase [Magnetofaba australis IT-1]